MVIVMKFLKTIIISIYIILVINYAYLKIRFNEYIKLIEAVASILILFGPLLIDKVLKIKIKEYIKVIYYLFFLLGFVIGFVYGFYYKTLYYDLLVHFLFGLLSSVVLNEYMNISKNIFKKIIIFSIVLSLSTCWEFLEFFQDILFNTDNQHKISGSIDTMTDLLVCSLGIVIYFIADKIKRLFSIKKKHIIK